MITPGVLKHGDYFAIVLLQASKKKKKVPLKKETFLRCNKTFFQTEEEKKLQGSVHQFAPDKNICIFFLYFFGRQQYFRESNICFLK